MEYGVSVRRTTAVRIVSTRGKTSLATIGQDMPRAFEAVWSWMRQHDVACTNSYALALYPDPEFNPRDITFEVGFPVSPDAIADGAFEAKDLPPVEVASVFHVGPYEEMKAAYEALFGWLEKNGKRPTGPCREEYLNDPEKVPPAELRTEIMVPIA